ncbi:MAG: ferritin-like domain-containing protein [Thermoleophilaceae bacterium]|nr:ferritin-like domain-containing protein [Thermoleophilaceae bacterium]
MPEALDFAYKAIEEEHSDESAMSRRKLVGGAAASLGSLGVLGLVNNDAWAAQAARNTPSTILSIAATAEVLATIVNTVGPEKLGPQLATDQTLANVQAAAREELIHYDVLRSVGGKPLTKKIWIPDAVFASRENLLKTLEVGDQIFINAYLIGTTAFATAGGRRNAKFARFTGEFMGAEAVHRALARQSLGKLGNDRVFMKYSFTKIETAVTKLQKAGFGFGKKGTGSPGQFYSFDQVRKRTPNPAGVNTRTPR